MLLYPDAPLSKEASYLSVYQFAVSNNLTDHATEQLLDLIRIHCPPSNACPPSLYKLKKQLGLTDGVTNLQYCSCCMSEVLKVCPKEMCRKKKSQLCYFSILPFQSHLHSIFTSKKELFIKSLLLFTTIIDHWDAVQYPFTRKSKSMNLIHDIQDGSKYERLMNHGGFLSVPEHVGLILFSDGVPLFKSSGKSVCVCVCKRWGE